MFGHFFYFLVVAFFIKFFLFYSFSPKALTFYELKRIIHEIIKEKEMFLSIWITTYTSFSAPV